MLQTTRPKVLSKQELGTIDDDSLRYMSTKRSTNTRSIKMTMPAIPPPLQTFKITTKENIKQELLRDWKRQEKYFSRVIAQTLENRKLQQ